MITKKKVKAIETLVGQWFDVFAAIAVAKSNINPIFKIVLIPWCMDRLSNSVKDNNYELVKVLCTDSEEKGEITRLFFFAILSCL